MFKKTEFKRIWLTPAGAGIAMISFFLPWIRISCMGTHSYAGHEFGGIFWGVLAAAAMIFVFYFALTYLKRKDLIPTATVIFFAVAFALIFYGAITMSGGKRILLIKLGPDDVNLRLDIGGWGMIVGYLASLAGVLPLRRVPKSKPKPPATIDKELEKVDEVEEVANR